MNAHILIIDDDKDLTKLIKKYLENHDFKATIANDPVKALAWLDAKQNKCDLIILDITMPVMDGFQVLRKIRRMEAGKMNNSTNVTFQD